MVKPLLENAKEAELVVSKVLRLRFSVQCGFSFPTCERHRDAPLFEPSQLRLCS